MWTIIYCLYIFARHFTLTVPLSNQVYKWVPANVMSGVTCNGPASNPGAVEIFLVASCYRNWDKFQSGGPLGSYADFQTQFITKEYKQYKFMGIYLSPEHNRNKLEGYFQI